MKLVSFTFAYPGPFGDAMSSALEELAKSIAEEPGLVCKIWTENAETQEAGGVYLFDDAETAAAYTTMHTARLAEMGVANPEVKVFDVNLPLTHITGGPV